MGILFNPDSAVNEVSHGFAISYSPDLREFNFSYMVFDKTGVLSAASDDSSLCYFRNVTYMAYNVYFISLESKVKLFSVPGVI